MASANCSLLHFATIFRWGPFAPALSMQGPWAPSPHHISSGSSTRGARGMPTGFYPESLVVAVVPQDVLDKCSSRMDATGESTVVIGRHRQGYAIPISASGVEIGGGETMYTFRPAAVREEFLLFMSDTLEVTAASQETATMLGVRIGERLPVIQTRGGGLCGWWVVGGGGGGGGAVACDDQYCCLSLVWRCPSCLKMPCRPLDGSTCHRTCRSYPSVPWSSVPSHL
jgi:hypothetical protein